MDAVYFYKHSPHGGAELHYSLRSLEKFAPYIRKVWIFGDCPAFISRDKSIIEHVPHAAVNALGVKTPVVNFFLLYFLSSLIPELSHDYLRLSDDFILLQDLSEEDARKDRCIGDLTTLTDKQIAKRPRTEWHDSLDATYSHFKRLGRKHIYNFETHTPAFMTKTRCMQAYLQLRDSVTEHKFTGLMGATAILNCAQDLQLKNFEIMGAYSSDPGLEWLEAHQKPFFNFDDGAFGPGVKEFLRKNFPDASKYESLT